MKQNFAKILSLVLCLCMLLSVCAFNAFANDEAQLSDVTTSYYVKAGASSSNDGRTSATPAATLGAVIDSINADGHAAGDNVTVYVMRADDEIRSYTQAEIDAGKIKFVGFETAKAHEATITYTSYDLQNRSMLLHKAGYALSGTSHSTHLNIKGPTNFKSIDIGDTRADNAGFNIYCYGFDCVFDDVKLYKPNIVKENGKAVSATLDKSWYSHLQIGGYNNNKPIGDGGTVVIKDCLSDIQNLRISGTASASSTLSTASLTYTDNVTIKIGNGESQTLKNIIVDTTGSASLYTTYAKNLSIVADNVKVSGNFANSTSTGAVVNGAVQIILNNGSSMPATPNIYKNAEKTIPADVYRITSCDGVTLDVTAEAGKFSVDSENIAYVVTADGTSVYYSVDGFINIKTPGVYNVNTAESLEQLVGSLSAPAGDFKEWDSSVAGVVKAVFNTTDDDENEDDEDDEDDTPKYYVKWNTKGTGLSPESPVSTVADAIALINAAGYGKDDVVEIYVINDDTLTEEETEGNAHSEFWWYDKDGNYVENFIMTNTGTYGRNTAWSEKGGAAGDHAATIVVKGYTEDAKLFQSQIIGYNTNITLGGTTVFEDVTIVVSRHCDREIFANGHDVTFNNVKFMYQRADNSAGSTKYTGLGDGHLRFSPSGSGTGAVDGLTAVFSTALPQETDTRYGLVATSTKANTFTGHVKYYLNGNSDNGAISWGQAASVFEDGLSFVVNAGTYALKKHSTNVATIAGGFQVVTNNGTSFENIPFATLSYDEAWFMSSADKSGNALDVTDTAGTFTVIGGKTAWATDKDGFSYASVDGVLEVPAGSYTVTYSEGALQATGKLYLDGEEYCDFVPGTAVSLPTLGVIPGKTFVGWGYEGDLYSTVYQTKVTDTVISLHSQYDVNPDTCVYYVDDVNGNDENEGNSTDKAFATLNKAIQVADLDENTNKYVVIIGGYEISKTLANTTLAKHENMIIISGDGSENSQIEKIETISINGPTTFENIRILNKINSKHIDSSAQKLVIGENVTFVSEGSYRKSFDVHSGVVNKNATARENVEINSKVDLLYVGTYYNTKERSFIGGDYTINSTVDNFAMRADGYVVGETKCNLASVYNGTVAITLNEGGRINQLTSGTSAVYNEKTAVHIFMNGGSIGSIADEVMPYVYKIGTENFTSTEYLTDGNAPGVFAVAGAKAALATDKDGAQYVSHDGLLELPRAGEYSVEFVDEVYYTNTGTRIDFYQDMTLDIASVSHTENDGKVFLGWTYEDGEVPSSDDFKVGDVLVARYADIDLDNTFYIEGAQIRTQGSAGLRYILRKADVLDTILPEIESFGAVVIPSDVLYDYPHLTQHDLELDKTYDYSGKKYTSAEVPAEKIYQQMDDGIRYTLVIANMTEEYYGRMYTVRGYARFVDYNGVERVLYTDYYATRHVNVAEAVIRDEKAGNITLTNEQRDYFNGIIKAVKAANALEFSGEHKPMGGDPNDENTFKYVYEIGTTGIQVRDVHVYPSDYVEGETDREPLVVIQTSDLHFNYTSDEDFKEANPSIMSTYLGRTAFRNTVPTAQKVLRYAYTGDAMVNTGDTLDFLSKGAIELATKHIFDVYPFGLMALGNHEGTRVCQQPDNAKAPDPTTIESRIEILRDAWKVHDAVYSSQVVGDRVLLIQMDDGTASKFWEEQIVPFENDLKLAREKGYTVLLFFHIPLRTANPNETAVDQLPNNSGRSDNSGLRDFTKEGIGESNDVNKKMFSLIREYSDVIYGMFTGHTHSPYYSEFVVEKEEGTNNVTKFIPQYTMTASAYSGGNATKIIIH